MGLETALVGIGLSAATASTVATVTSLASLGLTAYGAVRGSNESGKATAERQRGIRLQQNADEIRQARERRQQIREARIRQGAVVQNAANQGATTTSSSQGGVGSITSQMNSNLGYINDLGNINKSITSTNLAANEATSSANVAGSYANLGSTIFQASGGFQELFDNGADVINNMKPKESTYSKNMGWIDWN